MSSSGRQTPTSHLAESIARPVRSPKPCLEDASGGASDVIVVAPDDQHFTRIERALTASGYEARWVLDYRSVAQIRRRAQSMVLVAVSAEPVTNAPILTAIDVLHQQGYTILCYGERAGTWTLGAQSRLLIAGASHVLDSAQEEFAADLRKRLTDFVAAEAAREDNDRRLVEQMRGLGIVGASPAMMNVFRWIVRVSAVSSLSVLIVGETGTGKELAARAIHALDPRRRLQPFIAVNCGAMNAALAESELFGHRRGAFTGAHHDRRGLIRAANGGVLFLDEIADLELGLQAKLLRVLQERRVLALGEDHEVPVDVRIIAATNRDVEEMVKTSQFRADLFHRLGALSMRMPSLRERIEDTAALVDHFIAKHAGAGRDAPVTGSPNFMAALRAVTFPGNVRQLENVVQRAMVDAGQASQLRLRDLPPEIWAELARLDSRPSTAAAAGVDQGPVRINAVAVLEAARWELGRALDLCEEEMVAAALGASQGNRSRAARMLGISPRTFFNKMRKHRLIA